ncbi:YidC/Oxa1 family membrane protein insertase [Kitasatospora sp. MAP12-15]|uniref:membrane protein insertase YidC n=1 Tax=unclassified Kitasatospora TaxID=2633591 RepID=UPI00247545BD|nr:membrane protein insertase YidC [Kitasatospora sp. MAP12-44]MDH6111886.1 YidC/Oxa1 family membrane protein insertase [Kitasatospora sp. MAP12-44]
MTWSFLNPLYTAVSWIIVQFHSLYSHVFPADSGWAWGLAIASMVIVIRICLIPLFVKQIKSTRAMQAIQPKMKAIQERYKNDKQRQSEEMMKLYKEAGTNPFSSCLPILVQMPFFTALYGVLNSVAHNKPIGVIKGSLLESAQKAHIFGAPLSAKFTSSASDLAKVGASLTDVRVVTAVMIVMMSLSQFITQRQLMTKNMDLTVKTPFMQQQKMLMYVFPFMFAIMGINFPIGVLVYWLTTNVWSMGQQLVVIHNNPTPGSKAWDERQARLKASGRLNPDGTLIKGSGILAMFGGGKAAAQQQAAAAVTESVQVRRQQPRKQTKAQRQHVHTGAKVGLAKDGESEDEAPEDSVPTAQAADNKAESSTGTKRPVAKQGGGSSKRGPGQPQTGQRPKKKS